MSYMPRNSWFGSKTSSVPAPSGSEQVQNFYNPGHNQQPMWNNGAQQEPYWHEGSNPPSVPDQNVGNVQNSGGERSAWDWGPPASYQVQYQTAYHTTDQPLYGNVNSQSVLTSSNDPWNWGIDDTSSNDGVANNNVETADPAWNWSVEVSTSYQQQQPSTVTDTHSNYQPQPSVYSDCQQTPSSVYYQQPVPTSCETLPTRDQVDEAFAVTSKANNYNLENANRGFQTEPKHSSEFFSKTLEVDNSTRTRENAKLYEQDYIQKDNKTTEKIASQPETTHHQTVSLPSTTSPHGADFNRTMASSTEGVDDSVPEMAVAPTAASGEETVNTSYPSDPTVVSESKQLDPSFETDQLLNNKLSISSVMHHNRQLLMADGLVITDRQDVEFFTTSKHGSTGLTPQWSTESLPSQGSDEVTNALEGSRSEIMSPVSKSPCQGFQLNQCDNFSNSPAKPPPMMDSGLSVESLDSGKLVSTGESKEYIVSDRYLPTNSPLTVENVCREMHDLYVDASRKVDELGNSEIAPPESNFSHQPPGTETGPPVSVPLPPPKMTAPNVSGNPYAANKNSLRHNSKNMYRLSPIQFVGATAATSLSEDPGTLHSNDVKTLPPTYGTESASTMDQSRANVTGDHDVNLETPPDNKERPDVLEPEKCLSPSSSTRENTPSVVQELSTRQWGQQAGYSVSPENLEVAPRCGLDRNQYLETGQLSDDEIDAVSQYCLSDASSWSGLQRMVPGQMTGNESTANQSDSQSSTRQTFNEDVSTPPPGLHRMVPGQTEQENLASDVADTGPSQVAGGDVMLQRRMVPGRMTDEDPTNINIASGEEIPPPGLRRMIPGESSSPETQVIGSSQQAQTFQPISSVPMEARVVTGVSREEVQLTHNASVTTTASPTPQQTQTNKTQPTSERSETIGSDNIEAYPPTATDTSTREAGSSNRRENGGERDRRHREEEPIDDRENRHRGKHSSYRDRDHEESPGGGRYEQGKRSHRSDRDHKHGEGERRDEHRRDRHNADTYDKKRRDRDRTDRPKSSRRHNESPEGRRYRDDRTLDRKRYDRDGYSNYPPTQSERRQYSRRHEYRDADTGSEYSDYERGENDRRGYDRRERDYERRDKPGYRVHDDYTRYREDSHRYRDSRSHHDRKKLDSQDKLYRDSHDHRPDLRDPTQVAPGYPGFPGMQSRGLSDLMNYYNNLRTYDSAAYAEWYNNVYKPMVYQQPVSYSEDRGSVHSGRSSANSGRYIRERYERSGVYDATDYYHRSPVSLGSSDLRLSRELEQTTTSMTDDHVPMSPHRLTPSKFATAHVKATLTPRGHVVKVLPHYPVDGQPGIVEVHDIQSFVVSDHIKTELSSFPGPLVKGVTHKNSLIAFCNSKIKKAESSTSLFDRESVILLWRLLVLLLRQNGTVVGTDIAELLLSDHQVPLAPNRPSAGSSPALHASRENFSQDEITVTNTNRSHFNVKSEEEITNTFREYLLYGNTKEALEWAMKNSLWGHALFLASKMDQRTYANVMTRFANGLTLNDPLQTLYQLMSGRQPAAVTCCADEKWGDWRPHLAMILSNSSSQRVDLNYKAITTLGDTLGARGCLHAAHFTYLMAQVSFGTYAQRRSKLVLLGSLHHKSFEEFASNEAIQMTEIYEYANRLADPDFTIVSLQPYKLLYARRLAEQGFIAETMQYAEELSNIVLQHPQHYDRNFIKDIYEMGDLYKHIDPLQNCVGEELKEDLPWLVKLEQLIGAIDYGNIQDTYPNYGSVSNISYTDGDGYLHGTQSVDHLSQISEQVQYDYNWQLQQQEQQQQQQHLAQQTDLNDVSEAHAQAADTTQIQQTEWPNTPQSVSQWETQGHSTMIGESVPQLDQPYSSYWEQPPQQEELPTPQITLPNSVPAKKEASQDSEVHPKPATKPIKKGIQKSGTGNGWFGGLWNKLALRPKNQMKLPDDKNPTIVWDSERKCWTNLEADGDDPANDLPPPPKASSLMTNTNQMNTSQSQTNVSNHIGGDHSQPNILPPASANTGTNIYKMNRGRSSRSNYVDVLGGQKPSSQILPPPAEIFPSVTTQPQSMTFFVPGSSEIPETSSTEFAPSNTTTANGQNDSSGQHLSRWSSTSSLSREVQSYMMRGRHSVGPKGNESSQGYGAPLMFNPSEYSQPQPHPSQPTKLNTHYKNRYPQVK